MEYLEVYTTITSIELADNNNVYNITQEELHPNFLEDLKGYYENNLRDTCRDHTVALNKKKCLELSEEATVTGYGKYSGKKLWQLPTRLRNQVFKMVTSTQVELEIKMTKQRELKK